MLIVEDWECLGDTFDRFAWPIDSTVLSMKFKEIDFTKCNRDRAFWILLQFLFTPGTYSALLRTAWMALTVWFYLGKWFLLDFLYPKWTCMPFSLWIGQITIWHNLLKFFHKVESDFVRSDLRVSFSFKMLILWCICFSLGQHIWFPENF